MARWRELELVRKQNESREDELDKKEEKLESLEKEIEVREKVLVQNRGCLKLEKVSLQLGKRYWNYRGTLT